MWLGRASVAITTGDWDEAAHWLERCGPRRPDDQAVWRTPPRPGGGHAGRGRVLVGRRPSSCVPIRSGRGARAGPWLMGVRRDGAARGARARALVAADPGNTKALERLGRAHGRLRPRQGFRGMAPSQGGDRPRPRHLPQDPLRRRGPLQPRRRSGRPHDDAGPPLRCPGVGRSWPRPSFAIRRRRQPAPPSRPRSLRCRRACRRRRQSFPRPTRFAAAWLQRPAGILSPISSSACRPAEGAALSAAGSSGTDSPRVIPAFVDDAEKAGLRFVFDNGKTSQHELPETMSGGLGLLDFDGDGWFDVYCVQGGPLHALRNAPQEAEPPAGDRLFRNRGDGTFEDVTDTSGLARIAGAAATARASPSATTITTAIPTSSSPGSRSYALYRNRGDGTFEDVTERAGLGGRAT